MMRAIFGCIRIFLDNVAGRTVLGNGNFKVMELGGFSLFGVVLRNCTTSVIFCMELEALESSIAIRLVDSRAMNNDRILFRCRDHYASKMVMQ